MPQPQNPGDTLRRSQGTDGYFSAVREDEQIQFGGSFNHFSRGFGKPLLIAECSSSVIHEYACLPSFLSSITETV